MSIVVIGSINTDLIIQVPRFARKDETVLGTGGYTVSQGGKGANQAVAAIAGGLPVHMVGKVGNDAFGDDALDSLRDAGVMCEYVQRSDTDSTGLATIFLDPEARNSITVAPGANAQMRIVRIKVLFDKMTEYEICIVGDSKYKSAFGQNDNVSELHYFANGGDFLAWHCKSGANRTQLSANFRRDSQAISYLDYNRSRGPSQQALMRHRTEFLRWWFCWLFQGVS